MKRILGAVLVLGLASCQGAGSLTPEQAAAGGASAVVIQADAAKVQSACAEAMSLANFAVLLPVVGPYVATGVQVGCGTADGLARLAADPSTAQWLGQQIQIMKAALGR